MHRLTAAAPSGSAPALAGQLRPLATQGTDGPGTHHPPHPRPGDQIGLRQGECPGQPVVPGGKVSCWRGVALGGSQVDVQDEFSASRVMHGAGHAGIGEQQTRPCDGGLCLVITVEDGVEDPSGLIAPRSPYSSADLQLSWIEEVHQRQCGLVLPGEGVDQHLKSVIGVLSR